jgi:signal peptide peptidase SppA
MAHELQNVAHVGSVHGDIWAVEHGRMRSYLSTFAAERAFAADPDTLEARCCPRKLEYYGLDGTPAAAQGARPQSLVGVIPLVGPITHRASAFSAYFGGTSLQKWEAAFREMAANPAVGAIVMDIDSPGGQVSGLPEVAETIRSVNRSKPVVAVANTWTASAAYYLASQAGEIVVTPSGEIGSVGVYSLHIDYSEALKQMGIKATFIFAGAHKVEGNAYEPLSAEALEYEQSIVDSYYQDFLEAVAKGRNTTPTNVSKTYGEGRMLRPAKAVEVGMADRVGTLESAIRRVGGTLQQRAKDQQAADHLKLQMDLMQYES